MNTPSLPLGPRCPSQKNRNDSPSRPASQHRRRIPIVSTLPALTVGQLAMLSSVGTPFAATIRRTGPGYTVEVDVGPRRWLLVSTHRKTPRLFFHLDGAARAVARLKPASVVLQLDESTATCDIPSAALPAPESRP